MAAKTRERKGNHTDSFARELAALRAELNQLWSKVRELEADRKRGLEELPSLPALNGRGNYPAIETARVLLARELITRRKAAGWSQAELAARAGVRQETVSRLETGKHAPNVATVDKIDWALRQAEARAEAVPTMPMSSPAAPGPCIPVRRPPRR
ncbi:MAG TPA: helix-turn-helix transcriptional regulator [Gemmataceae bacterium]|nr:helix-turn-helix transcriptional regulator [Gemmataceae bacterium]